MTLLENKSIHRHRAEKQEKIRTLKKQQQRSFENLKCFDIATNTIKDSLVSLGYKFNYLFVSMVKVLPSVIFRLFCIWLTLSYTSEFYLRNDNNPGLGIGLPFVLIIIITMINYRVGYWYLGLKSKEAIVNSIGNLVLPVYIDLYYLVSFKNILKAKKVRSKF